MKKIILGILFLVLNTQLLYAKDVKLKHLPSAIREKVMALINIEEDVTSNLSKFKEDENFTSESSFSLNRITMRLYTFISFDFLFFEGKVKPYVELRWVKP